MSADGRCLWERAIYPASLPVTLSQTSFQTRSVWSYHMGQYSSYYNVFPILRGEVLVCCLGCSLIRISSLMWSQITDRHNHRRRFAVLETCWPCLWIRMR